MYAESALTGCITMAEQAKPVNRSPGAYTQKVVGPRLYVVNHLPDRLLGHFDSATQICVGPAAALAPPGELTDILCQGQTLENRRWSELSAIYKIWQEGPQSDIVGFCHYRRYFYFGDEAVSGNEMHVERSQLASLGFDRNRLLTVNERTAIVPMETRVPGSVYAQYGLIHNSLDYLDIFKLALLNYPEITKYIVAQFESDKLYTCNMFVLSWRDFDELCRFWFTILGKFCDAVPWPRGDSYQDRDVGFLAERLFDAWIRFKRDSGHTLIELPMLLVT
jgi:hypothetical protein